MLDPIPPGRLTLGYLTLDIDPLATVDAAGRAGFQSVGIRITGRRLADSYREVIGSRETIAAIRRRVDEHGFRLSNISAYHFYPDVTMAHLDAVLDAAAELGADTMIANSYLADQSRFLDMFCSYCEMAEKRGIRLAIEFMRYSQVKSLAAAAEIVRRPDQVNAGLMIDPLHLDRAEEAPADIGASIRGASFSYNSATQGCDPAPPRTASGGADGTPSASCRSKNSSTPCRPAPRSRSKRRGRRSATSTSRAGPPRSRGVADVPGRMGLPKTGTLPS